MEKEYQKISSSVNSYGDSSYSFSFEKGEYNFSSTLSGIISNLAMDIIML